MRSYKDVQPKSYPGDILLNEGDLLICKDKYVGKYAPHLVEIVLLTREELLKYNDQVESYIEYDKYWCYKSYPTKEIINHNNYGLSNDDLKTFNEFGYLIDMCFYSGHDVQKIATKKEVEMFGQYIELEKYFNS